MNATTTNVVTASWANHGKTFCLDLQHEKTKQLRGVIGSEYPEYAILIIYFAVFKKAGVDINQSSESLSQSPPKAE